MAFEPVKRLRLGQQIAGTIRDAILSGRYASGNPLPSERDLATQFGVARTSVREALHRLEAQGLVELRHGAAPKVRDFLTSVGVQLLPHLIAPAGSLDPQLFSDLMRLRAGLLGWVAKEATSQLAAALDEDSQHAKKRLENLHSLAAELQAATDQSTRQALDFQFFIELIQLADNRVMLWIAGSVAKLYQAHQKLFASLYADEIFDAGHHLGTVEAIERGNRDAAGEAMEAFGLSALNSEVLRCP